MKFNVVQDVQNSSKWFETYKEFKMVQGPESLTSLSSSSFIVLYGGFLNFSPFMPLRFR